MSSRSDAEQTYYVPEQSKLPFLATIGLATFIYGAGATLNAARAGDPDPMSWLLPGGFAFFVAVLWQWFGTSIREHRLGLANAQLRRSYVLGMQWFIFSEVMFFFAFFLALAYVRLFVVPWLGGEGDHGLANRLWSGFAAEWPPSQTPQQALDAAGGTQLTARQSEFLAPPSTVSWSGIPLLNTILLLSSSVTLHFAHVALRGGRRGAMNVLLALTLALGMTFVALQAWEYHHAYTDLGLTLKSGIYGSTFYLLTGFHGLHVCIGALMLSVTLARARFAGDFTPEDHFGFQAASWYWHFVDVVWVCLFLSVYLL
ncbi:MAG: Cytochrome c oxidase subunit 3 [Pseudomonadales bacterium]|nr:Cytochrome c oxidase subunit 3 [Pseudomonadales bacterium]